MFWALVSSWVVFILYAFRMNARELHLTKALILQVARDGESFGWLEFRDKADVESFVETPFRVACHSMVRAGELTTEDRLDRHGRRRVEFKLRTAEIRRLYPEGSN